MFSPQSFKETRINILHQLIKRRPLGVLSAIIDDEIIVNHIPFVLEEKEGEFGMLQCHVARANPVWKGLSQQKEVVVIFQGENSYISPSWYPSKQEHGKVVPTWNYIAVQARGLPKVIEDRHWLLAHVSTLSDAHESAMKEPWKVADAPAEYINKLTNAIVGIEIPITALNGTWKLSQNRSKEDQVGIIENLESQADANARSIAKALKSRMK